MEGSPYVLEVTDLTLKDDRDPRCSERLHRLRCLY